MSKHDIYPRMLLINDIHLSKDNIAEFQKNWDEALNICKSLQIGVVVIGGDLWQSRTGQTLSTLMAARDAILKADKSNILVIIEPGNHDKVDPESILSYNHIFSAYPNVDVVDEYASYAVSDNVVLWLIGYFPENGSFISKLNDVVAKLSANTTNILYCHEGINGAISAPSNKELPVDIFKPFDKVLVGHYHNRATIAGGLIEYIGSSRQHNFGEDEEKGYTILFSDGSTQFVKNAANVRFATIEVDIDNLEEAKELLRQNDNESKKIRLKISCTSDQTVNIDKNALLELGASKVEVEADSASSCARVQDLTVKFNKNGLKEEYSRFCIQKELDNIEMGLRYLDKIEGTCGN